MATKKALTEVIFLMDIPENDHASGVFALFPKGLFNSNDNGTFICYAHVGQHSACHIDYANKCKEATPEQYADLKKELESVGYDLKVISRKPAANTPNVHVLIVKHVGMTDLQPARVKIISERFKVSVTIPYDNEPGSNNPMIETAENWLKKNGFDVIGIGLGKGHMYIITDTFKSLK